MGGGQLDGARVLAEPTVAVMSANAMGGLRCRTLKSAVPGSTNDVDFLDGWQWGLSFLINPDLCRPADRRGSLAWARPRQFLLLDRSEEARRRIYATQLLPFYDADAGSAVRRVRK